MDATPLAGIIAGTLRDTDLGQHFLHQLGWRALVCATARTAAEQDHLQRRHPAVLQGLCLHAVGEMADQGAEQVIIYCSSLSSVLDLQALRSTSAIPVRTPLDGYAEIARRHSRIAVLAANTFGLSGAMSVLQRERPDVDIMGTHDLGLVCALERGEPPAQAVAGPLRKFLEEAAHCCDAVLLACTHFPLIAEEVVQITALPVYHVNTWLQRELGLSRTRLRAPR